MKRVRVVALAASLMALAIFFQAHAQQEPTAARQTFETNCAACHGPGGAGGERAPALNGNPDLRKLSAADIGNIIREGTSGGMPAFSSLPASDVAALAGWIHSMNLSALATAPPEKLAAGERFFFGEGGCSSCHMVHGRGAVNGPDLTNIAARSTMPEMEKVLDDPTSQMGVHSLAVCPPWAFCPDFSWAVVDVTLKNGTVLRGFARKRTEHELQLQSFDGKLHLLDAGEYTLVRQEKAIFHAAPEGHSGAAPGFARLSLQPWRHRSRSCERTCSAGITGRHGYGDETQERRMAHLQRPAQW